MKEKIKTEREEEAGAAGAEWRKGQGAHKLSRRKYPQSCHTARAPQDPSLQDSSLQSLATGASGTQDWQVGITLAADWVMFSSQEQVRGQPQHGRPKLGEPCEKRGKGWK